MPVSGRATTLGSRVAKSRGRGQRIPNCSVDDRTSTASAPGRPVSPFHLVANPGRLALGAADQVVHCRYATHAGQPWIGLSPLTLAGTTGRLAVNLERALRDEAGGPVGNLIPLPVDAGGETSDPDDESDPFAGLKAQINKLAGRCGLVETTSAGFAEGRAAAPAQDWQPRRLGANPPVSLVDLRAAVEQTVLSACGVPPGLARAEGGESRESYRRWYAAGVLPLARVVESELRHKLDVPALRLDFASLATADVSGRARAWRSLVGRDATMSDADARARLVDIGLGLRAIAPLHVAAYIRTHPGSAPTVKQHLAAIRVLCDWLVVHQVLPANPAAAVRGPKPW